MKAAVPTRVIAAAYALCCVTSLRAQPEPQFVWEGEVDGIAVLYIRGNRVDIENKQGAPVQRQRFRFYDRLPDSRQNVRLEAHESRGGVRVTQQPRLENNYTAAVTIEDRQSGSAFYSLALRWETNAGSSFDSPDWNLRGRFDRLMWSGRVDDEVIIECRDNACRSVLRSGQPVSRERFRFSRRLPGRDVQVSLDETDGRGDIRLVEQPDARNGYTARVLIRDHQGGADDYAFTLSWQRPSRNEPDRLYTERGLTWWGRVDDRVRVVVEDKKAFSEVLTGHPVGGERFTFHRNLPRRGTLTPEIKKVRGRGRVEIVEFPSNRNGYRLVFEIRDSDGGADNYQVELSW
jgi:hypothetical protein